MSAEWRDLPGVPTPGTAICRLDELLDGGVTLIVPPGVPTEGPAPFSLLVLREGDVVRAFLNRCPHFGVPLSRTQQHLKFVSGESLTCNVHYSRFRWRDGLCDRGDCVGDALTAVPVTLAENGVVLLG